jgi:hypothetical protein
VATSNHDPDLPVNNLRKVASSEDGGHVGDVEHKVTAEWVIKLAIKSVRQPAHAMLEVAAEGQAVLHGPVSAIVGRTCLLLPVVVQLQPTQ